MDRQVLKRYSVGLAGLIVLGLAALFGSLVGVMVGLGLLVVQTSLNCCGCNCVDTAE